MEGEANNTASMEESCSSYDVQTLESPYHSAEGRIHGRLAIHLYPITKIRLLVNYMILVARLIVPVFLAAYSAWLRNQRNVVNGLRRQLMPGVLAVVASSVSLSALSRAIAIPCGKIDPLLRSFRAIYLTVEREVGERSECNEPEKSVHCDVLHDPGAGNIRADVIFIHGLHGSTYKTWRQGDWNESHARTVPLIRNKCYSISKRGNPAMVSLRKQPTFIHTDEEVNEILNQKDLSRKKSDSTEPDCQYFSYDDFSRDAIGNKVDSVINCSDNCGDDTSEKNSPCWPRDWLPVDCPGVRVIALNYTTDPFLWRPIWVSKRLRTCMVERSREMIEHLLELGVGENPIVWVGHSKGGLFIKQLIVDAYNSENTGLNSICLNTKGIMFYSVPHHGSPCADMCLPFLRKSVEVTEVERDCPTLQELHQQFLSLINSKILNVDIFSFIETIQTCMSIFYLQIVAFEAADPGVGEMWGVSIDHMNICKPTSRQVKHFFLFQVQKNVLLYLSFYRLLGIIS